MKARRLQRHYIALFFPHLTTDRLRKLTPERAELPSVVVERDMRGLAVIAINQRAHREGLYAGMSLVEARTLCPHVETIQADRQGDRAYLEKLAQNAYRFTPLVAYSLPDGLMLDVTGCDHLFGGPVSMLNKVRKYYQKLGLKTYAALCPNPAAARAFARLNQNIYIEKDQLNSALDELPLVALEVLPTVLIGLRRAGFHKIGQIRSLPAKSLAARFGEYLPIKLSCLYGHRHLPISPLHALPLYQAMQNLAEPVASQQAIAAVFTKLAQDFFAKMRQQAVGSRQLKVDFFRVDGMVSTLIIKTSQPLIKTSAFLELLEERIGSFSRPLDVGYGFDAFALSALKWEKISEHQVNFIEPEYDQEPLNHLIDRLAARFGNSNIKRAQSLDSHIPEEQAFWADALKCNTVFIQPASLENIPERPFRLFCPPQPIDVIAHIPDAPPHAFRWRRVSHKIRLVEGPERICAHWWKNSSLHRDYYRLEDENGQRFWVYRQETSEGKATKWFIHGLFA